MRRVRCTDRQAVPANPKKNFGPRILSRVRVVCNLIQRKRLCLSGGKFDHDRVAGNLRHNASASRRCYFFTVFKMFLAGVFVLVFHAQKILV
jgi:hypothetical protein